MVRSLDHVMIVSGDDRQWADASRPAWEQRWGDRLTALADCAGAAGTRWLTLRPYGTPTLTGDPARWVIDADRSSGRATLIVDATADGRLGFSRAVASIPGTDPVDEKRIDAALYAPADCEPDLIVIVGPHDRLPPSLVWELAYAELVFVAPSDDPLIDAVELDAAIAEYAGRDRRFGGLSPL